MTTRFLADLTWPEANGLSARLLIVPLGATEQHGPHLPLSTDSDIAVGLARVAATRIPNAVIAPVLPFGSSGEHQDFAGTLSIGSEATELVLVELGRSATETFDRVLFLNCHGGNTTALDAAVARLRAEGREIRAWSPNWGGDAHAGKTETSLMLALMPARVRDDWPAGTSVPLTELIDLMRANGVRAVSSNGVLGDATDASPTEGRMLLATAIENLCAVVRAWDGDVSGLTEKKP